MQLNEVYKPGFYLSNVRGLFCTDVFVLQRIGSLKTAPHDWYSGRHDLAGGRWWIFRDIVYSPSISKVAAQKERRQVPSSQYCTPRRLTHLIVNHFQCSVYHIFSFLRYIRDTSCLLYKIVDSYSY